MNADALLQAITLALEGKWDDAHRIVQSYEDSTAAWIHAVLHKLEGDDGNSSYWYRRAGKTFSHRDAHEELREIQRDLQKE